ncbi:MAG TPA: ABC transporter ATP-binding protein [Chitinivibrionales bacterium]|nr:ABC transporter ATP-binding protein [Chitinivibrionales bacterium]
MNISIEALEKTYPNGRKALSNINLEIESGMFGLLGPNGAGKSTLMRILVTLLEPTGGRVRVNGMDLIKERGAIRSILGYLPQDFKCFSRLSAAEFLDYTAVLAGMHDKAARRRAVEEMLTKVGLFDARDRMASQLSGGMKRRLGIAQALIGNPQLVIVDEPTTGLDPEERIRFRNLIGAMSLHDLIIIFSTHIVGDISNTCRSVALLSSGQLAYCGAPDELIRQAEGHVFRTFVRENELQSVKQRHMVVAAISAAGGWHVEMVARQGEDLSGEPVKPNLEHAYAYFMGKNDDV